MKKIRQNGNNGINFLNSTDDGPKLPTHGGYLNDLFTSEDPYKVAEFYNQFKNSTELIQWMRERPKGSSTIYEEDGDDIIIVVIPTANYNGKYATECRDIIFRGLRIVFVESTNSEEFNYAHNVNVGVRKAMERNPMWIVVSNDDMYKIDDINSLQREILKVDNREIDVLFTNPSKHHSTPVYYSKAKVIRTWFFKFLGGGRREQIRIESKFCIKHHSTPMNGYWRLFFQKGYKHLSIGDFGIFSSEYVKRKNNRLFDDTYINSTEDIDLSLEISINPNRYKIINYQIGDFTGSTLGHSNARHIRDISGSILLEEKIRKHLHPITTSLCNDEH